MNTTAKIYTWGGTTLATDAGDRFVDLASVLFTGTGGLTSAADKDAGTLTLTASPALDNELVFHYADERGAAAEKSVKTGVAF